MLLRSPSHAACSSSTSIIFTLGSVSVSAALSAGLARSDGSKPMVTAPPPSESTLAVTILSSPPSSR